MTGFVNRPAENRTVDEARGIELRFVDSGPERPNRFLLTVAGAPIGFEASVRTIETPGGEQRLVWTVHRLGEGFLAVQWRDGGSSFVQVPAHRFASAAERAAVRDHIGAALRVYRDLCGRIATPVAEVVFEPAAGGP
jgi:hypothetical protein